jgi:hypothetical protein
MNNPAEGMTRYLVRYRDGGAGMRRLAAPLAVGYELDDGGSRYRVNRVEQPPNDRAFGQAWADLLGH